MQIKVKIALILQISMVTLITEDCRKSKHDIMQNSSQRKPEQAIKRADEYIKYGKYGKALEVMYESLQSRKNRTWQPAVEEIVQRFLSVCLRLLNSVNSKDVLYQYKLTAQYTNTVTMEATFLKFIRNAEDQFQQALSKINFKIDLDNLDKYDSPEALLCKSISATNNPLETIATDESFMLGDERKSVIDFYTNQCKYNAVYSPICYIIQSMKFVWDCYRNVLDVCKNNRHTEKIYYDVFLMACKYCVKYNRRVEMKELCKLSRMHAYSAMGQNNNPNYSIDFNDKKSGFYQVDLRLKQLEVAINLELYPQSLKTIDLIHRIMCLSERIRKPSVVVIFHKLMVTFFAKSNMVIYHALALQRFFSIVASIKTNVTFEELSFLATKTLLATLSIPISYDTVDDSATLKSWYTDNCEVDHSEFFTIIEIFKLKTSPTRKILIDDLNYLNVLSYANTDAIHLYNLMEIEPVNINICQSINALLGKLDGESEKFLAENSCQKTSLLLVIPSAEITSYYDAIKLRALSLLLTKMNSIYKSIPIQKVMKYAPFYTVEQLYHILVFKHKNLPSNILIDDVHQCLYFTEKETFNYISESTPMDVLYRLENFLDGIFYDNDIAPPLEQQLESFHRETVTSGVNLLENERKQRAELYNVAIGCGHRREAYRKQREELMMRRREENRKQMDERAKLYKEKEQQKLEHERHLKAIDEENKLNQVKQSEIEDYNSNLIKAAEKELEEKDKVRRAQEELKLRIRTLERRIDHTIRTIRLEQIPKCEEYSETYGLGFNAFNGDMCKMQEKIARDKFLYRLNIKQTLLQYDKDIIEFYNKCDEVYKEECRQKYIQEQKLASVEEAAKMVEAKNTPMLHQVYSAKKDYDLNFEPRRTNSVQGKYTPSYNFGENRASKPYRPPNIGMSNYGANSFDTGDRFRQQPTGSNPNKPSTGPKVVVAKKNYF